MRKILALTLLVPLAGCGGTVANTVSTTGGDAVRCAASIAAAYTLSPMSVFTAGLAGCTGLAADVLALIESKAKVAAAEQRRAMGR